MLVGEGDAMDRGRRLTLQQKERLIRSLILFAVFLILDLALWLCFGRQKILLLIGCASAIIFSLLCVYLGINYGLLWIFERNGRRFTYQVRQNLKRVCGTAFLVSVCSAGYLLYTNMPELNDFFSSITSSIIGPEIKLELHLPDVNFPLPDTQLGFWHVASALVCLAVVILSFYGHIWCGIIALPVMAAYGCLFWRACDGNYPQDFAAYIELLKYGLIIMLVSGLLLRNFAGFTWLLGLVRFLFPFTLISVVAILLQDAGPEAAPPLNFRAILFWVLALAFFGAQSFQMFAIDMPEFTGPQRPDDTVADQSGDEYEYSHWW